MKKLLLLSLLILISAVKITAQWQVTGGYVGVNSASTFFICTSEIRVGGGTFLNKGKVTCGDLKSDAAGTIRGTGAYTIEGNLTNLGSILDNTDFTMSGTMPASITTSGAALYNLTLKKTGAGTTVSLADPLRINKKLTFSGANNKLAIGNFDLTFAPTATIGSATSTKFVATTGTGKVFKENLGATAFVFPIGATTSGGWNRCTISNSGTVDKIGVRVLPDALSTGGTGTPLTSDAVAATWQVVETTPGGSNLTLTCAWATADELAGFTRATCAVRRWSGSVWDSSPLGVAGGTGSATNPYNRQRAGITSDGYFSVLDGAFPVPPTPFAAARSESNFSLKIFPNPAESQVFVQSDLPDVTSLRVLDAAGRQVLFLEKPALSAGERLDVSRLAVGVYQIEVFSATGESLVERLVKIGN